MPVLLILDTELWFYRRIFFTKDWPQKELDGLVDRESEGHKVILPIWHRIDKKQVSGHSPMLAGRLAAKWEDGIEEIVKKILIAIDYPLSQKPSSTKTIIEKALALDKNLGFRQKYKNWHRSEIGVADADKSAQNVYQKVKEVTEEISSQSEKLKFETEFDGSRNFIVYGKPISLVINWTVTYANSLDVSGMSARLYKGKITFKRPVFYFEDPKLLKAFRFDADLAPNNTVVWKDDSQASFNAESLADFLFGELLDQIEKN